MARPWLWSNCLRHGTLLAILVLVQAIPRLRAAIPPESIYPSLIKPALRERCWACHGSLQQKAGLRLDPISFIRTGGRSGPAVLQGKPDESPLFQRISTPDARERMPPAHDGVAMDPAMVEVVRKWIEIGRAHV